MKDIDDLIKELEKRDIVLAAYRDDLDEFIKDCEDILDNVNGALEDIDDAKTSLENARDILSERV